MLPMYLGTRDALARIMQEEGWRALYAGIAPALLGAGKLFPDSLNCVPWCMRVPDTLACFLCRPGQRARSLLFSFV